MSPFSPDADDSQQVTEYHTLSVLAIVSLLVGLVAPLCFVAPLLLAVPLVGVAVSLIALRRIVSSEGALVGRGAAITGLALSVACLLASLSYTQAATYLRVQQAKDFGHAWLTLVVSGETERAYQLTVQGAEPPPPENEPGPPPENPYDTFVNHPVIRELTAIGPGGDVRFDGTLSYEARGQGVALVRQEFSIIPANSASSAASAPAELILSLQRARMPGEPQPKWLVRNYEKPDAAADKADDHGGHSH